MLVTEVVFSEHFKKQFSEKGFTTAQVKEAIENPYKITNVLRYPGQKRYCGGGIAIVMRGSVAVTVYLDGVVTPLREDQKSDPAALNSRRLKGGTR